MQPLPSVPDLWEGLSEANVSMSHMELLREAQDLDDYQLHEMLWALQTKITQRGGIIPSGAAPGISEGPWGQLWRHT